MWDTGRGKYNKYPVFLTISLTVVCCVTGRSHELKYAPETQHDGGRPGYCPPIMPQSALEAECAPKPCDKDDDCPFRGDKCCHNGCGFVCVPARDSRTEVVGAIVTFFFPGMSCSLIKSLEDHIHLQSQFGNFIEGAYQLHPETTKAFQTQCTNKEIIMSIRLERKEMSTQEWNQKMQHFAKDLKIGNFTFHYSNITYHPHRLLADIDVQSFPVAGASGRWSHLVVTWAITCVSCLFCLSFLI